MATTTQQQPVLGLPNPGERVPLVAWPTVALYLGTLGLFAAEMYGSLAASWSPWITVPIGAAVTFLMFSVLHESTHHAISTGTRLNNALGYISVPFVAPYASYRLLRFIHIEHHRNTNEPRRPRLRHVPRQGPARPGRDGPESRAQRRGDRHRIRPHLPGAPGQRGAPDRRRRVVGRIDLGWFGHSATPAHS